jgi:hypothetical protein
MTVTGTCAKAGVLLSLIWPTSARAYRPFDGTDADVASFGELELEVGPVGYERVASEHFLVAPALVLNYGVAPHFEAVVGGRQLWALSSPHTSKLEDVSLSLKTVLREGSLQAGRGVSVAVETGLLLPGSERRLGGHVASIFSWRCSAVALHLNLSNDLLTSLDYTATTSLIAEGPGRWLVRPVAELLLQRDFGSSTLTDGLGASLLVGAVTSWSDAWSVDLGLRHGRADDAPMDEVRLGFTWGLHVP